MYRELGAVTTGDTFSPPAGVLLGLLYDDDTLLRLKDELFRKENTTTNSKLGRKGFIQLTLQHCSSLKEVRTRTQTGQESGSRG